jgi:hypothetical protein
VPAQVETKTPQRAKKSETKRNGSWKKQAKAKQMQNQNFKPGSNPGATREQDFKPGSSREQPFLISEITLKVKRFVQNVLQSNACRSRAAVKPERRHNCSQTHDDEGLLLEIVFGSLPGGLCRALGAAGLAEAG